MALMFVEVLHGAIRPPVIALIGLAIRTVGSKARDSGR